MRPHIPIACAALLAASLTHAATPAHEFDASSASNAISGNSLTLWSDIGAGHNYSGGLFNIDLNFATGITLTPNFSSPGTNFTASFQSTGANTSGATPSGEPQSSSIGNGLTDGSVEIWFRTDLSDTDRLNHQVLWESGAATNGFTISLHTNGIFDPELRVLKAFNNVKIVDLIVPLPNFESAEFIQTVVTFDGDSIVDNNDTIKVYARDVIGNIAYGEALGAEFSTLAGADDSCAFSAAGTNNFGAFNSSGGNTGNTVTLSGFAGEIALIRIYDMAITQTDIDASYEAIADQGDDDGDGMKNFWEGVNGFDKDDPNDAALDADADGLDNLGEFNAGTDPHDTDSDNDTLTDGSEIAIGSNPLKTDSDDDGLDDAAEVSADPFITSPILADTDSDGLIDPVELMIGSDPTDASSVGTILVITEFMASNGFSLDDEDGDSSDWIEILNPTGDAIDLAGMALTDDSSAPQKWQFPPGAILPAGEFLIVFASGKNRVETGQELHTNFSLSASGEYLALIDADGSTPLSEFAPTYPSQQSDVSFGFGGVYFPKPSPGAVNISPSVSGFVADTSFSVDRGTYEATFTVVVSTPTAGATIIYTTDSSTPSPDNGTQIAGSSANILIDETTVLRAAAFKPGLAPTNVDTHTYLFLDDVVAQSDNVVDYEYPNWDNLDQTRTADYGMDSNIAGGIYTDEEVKTSLASLPVISMATDTASLFDRDTGNYSNSKKGGPDWEREVSLEFFGFGHGQTTQANAGLRLAGNASRSPNRHKHNMRVAFRRQYGTGTLDFPLFPGEDVTRFNSIQLRAGNGDSWVNPGTRGRATYLRDQWHRDAQIAMGQHSQSQIFAQLYINGWYWGVFHIFERIEDNFMVEHFGGLAEDYDVRDHINAFDGSDASWNAAVAIVDDAATMADSQNYAGLQDYINYTHLIDYLLIHFYSNSDDWDQNNLRSGRNRIVPDTYQFFAWDQERTLLNSLAAGNVNGAIAIDKNTNNTSKKGMTHFHQRLRANAEYRLLFADRVRKWCFHGGALSPTGANALWDERAAEARPAMIAESARWGDLHGTPAKTPTDWEGRVALEKSGWFDIRTPIFVQLLRDRDLYPQIEAPEYTIDGAPQHGGNAAPGAPLGITTSTGIVYFTLDGSDPRETTTGNAVGIAYTTPIPLTSSLVAKARTLDAGVWSALTESEFFVGTPPSLGDLVISELMYHPAGDGLAEYVELQNISDHDVDMSGVQFVAGISFTFPIGFRLGRGERTLIVRDLAAFESVHGNTLPVVGQFADGSLLSDGGETLTLINRATAPILSFTYNDGGAWPRGADGSGYSLVLIKPASAPDHNHPASWRSSKLFGGNPSTSDAVSFASWAAANGVTDPLDDSDGDQLPAAIEFLLGSDPSSNRSSPTLTTRIESDAGDEFLTFSFQRAVGADDATTSIEFSSDLEAWSSSPIDTQLIRNERIGAVEILTVRSRTPVAESERRFMRLSISVPEL
ncbi:MAG: hypothetical protein ACI9NC_004479 [Verrucomicrobiales bacterium]|jgi:hypothetical protein